MRVIGRKFFEFISHGSVEVFLELSVITVRLKIHTDMAYTVSRFPKSIIFLDFLYLNRYKKLYLYFKLFVFSFTQKEKPSNVRIKEWHLGVFFTDENVKQGQI